MEQKRKEQEEILLMREEVLKDRELLMLTVQPTSSSVLKHANEGLATDLEIAVIAVSKHS